MTTHHLHTDYCCTCAGKIKNSGGVEGSWLHFTWTAVYNEMATHSHITSYKVARNSKSDKWTGTNLETLHTK